MGIRPYNIEKAKENLEHWGEGKGHKPILEENKRLILEHDEYIKNIEELGEARRYKYLVQLPKLAESIDKPFDKIERNHIEEIIKDVKYRKDINNTTKDDYLVLLIKFMKWIKDDEHPDIVKGITIKHYNETKPLKKLLIPEDIDRMIDYCKNPRDKALITFLFESGCRVGELVDLNVGDIRDRRHGVWIDLSGKTGERSLPLSDCVPYLNTYLSVVHPERDSDSPLFVNIGQRNHGERMKYQAINKLLKVVGKRAEIDKPMNPHHFRKSRATDLLKKGYSEQYVKKYMGWKKGSRVIEKYVELNDKHMEDEYDRRHGFEPDDPEDEDILESYSCPRCQELVSPKSKFCDICGFALSESAISELEEAEVKVEEKTAEIEDELQKKFLEAIKGDGEFREKLLKVMEDD